jgi:hypothetical protein
MSPQIKVAGRKTVARLRRAYIGCCHVFPLTQDAREEVPTLLINTQIRSLSPEAAVRPLAGSGAGAFLCEGTPAGTGAKAGLGASAGQLPRHPWASAPSAASAAARGGYQPISSMQFDQKTLINPVATGGLGPHPVREPEPV